jgi:hypothetical protein
MGGTLVLNSSVSPVLETPEFVFHRHTMLWEMNVEGSWRRRTCLIVANRLFLAMISGSLYSTTLRCIRRYTG